MDRHRLRGGRIALLGLLCLALLLANLAVVPPPVTEAQAGLPSSKVSDGVYYVYATRQGLVGGWTSSGHKILENDFFVSLPSCTPQSCPWGATRGNMTQCGNACYVKVVNPTTQQCRVEPIKDTGPWFTVDDWWNPTNSRYLNTLSSNPQDLPQGYTAADAARDGLDVGYGVSPAGIGHDNTGTIPGRPVRQVGNRAAIDLADGTWRNLQLTAADRVGTRIYVHMLWQTGGNPVIEAARCGHPLNQVGTQPSPTPTPSPTPVTPTPTVLPTSGSFATVQGTGGDSLRCRTGPSTGASIITNLPEGTRVPVRGVTTGGWVPVRCANRDGWAYGAYLRVTSGTPNPTPTPSPTATPGQTTTTAVVAGTGGAGLRCRTGPSTGAGIIATMPEGTRMTVRGVAISGWVPVRCSNRDGWASGSYLRIEQTQPGPSLTPTPTQPPGASFGVVSNAGGDNVRCRTQASLSAPVIASLPEGTRVQLRGPASGNWWPIRCANRDGFMWADYISPQTSTASFAVAGDAVPVTEETLATGTATPSPTQLPPTVSPTVPGTEAAPSPTAPGTEAAPSPTASSTEALPSPTPKPPPPTPMPVTGHGYVASETGVAVNCRVAPSTDAAIITVVTHGGEIALRGEPFDGWQGVVCGSQDGYVAAQFISSTPPPTLPPEPTATPPQEPEVDETEEDVDEPVQSSARPGSNPWLDGAPLAVADVWADGGATSAWNTVDGSQGSVWYSVDGAGQASITLDLGAVQQVTGVRWMYAESGGADNMRLLVSLDGSSWTQLVTTSNRAPYTWEGLPTALDARFVRLTFDNPNGVPVLGLLAEVEVWGFTPATDAPAPAALGPAPASRVAVRTPVLRPQRRTGKGSLRRCGNGERTSRRNSEAAVHWTGCPGGTGHKAHRIRPARDVVCSVGPGRHSRACVGVNHHDV